MSLTKNLSDLYEKFHGSVPASVSTLIKSSTSDFKASFELERAIGQGSVFPDFSLRDANGRHVSLAGLLKKGAVLIAFYRGGWCPYCSLELHALQAHVDHLRAKGVTLVAISPELPDQSLSTIEKEALSFSVLSDEGNKLARRLGIVFAQPETMRGVFKSANVDLRARNGDDSMELPIPATYLVDTNGVITNAFIDPDYTKRLDPEEALHWASELDEAHARSSAGD